MFFSRNGQVAHELLVVFLFLTLGFTILMMFLSSAQERAEIERQQFYIRDFGLRIQDELYTVFLMPQGFQRNLELPATLYGIDYTLNITDTGTRMYLVIEAGDQQNTFLIPNTSGNFSAGGETNRLGSRQGYVCLNEKC